MHCYLINYIWFVFLEKDSVTFILSMKMNHRLGMQQLEPIQKLKDKQWKSVPTKKLERRYTYLLISCVDTNYCCSIL